MTVCIAAIYGNECVVGASDRLLTAGDVQFQPNMPKIRTLTNSIVTMTSGDAWLQTEILSLVASDVTAAIEHDPAHWVDIRYVVDRYCEHWAGVKRRRAEHQILKPLGLTTDSFLVEQATMNERSVLDISNALVGFAMPVTASLIAGVDASGPHIYAIYDGVPSQADGVGFAAIGTGARHAEFQLMLAQYAPSTMLTASLALVHLAKSRAEVAPGVGAATDMFIIGPRPGTYTPLPLNLMAYLRQQADIVRTDEARALLEVEQGLGQFLDSMGPAAQESQEAEPEPKDADPESRNGAPAHSNAPDGSPPGPATGGT